MRLDTLKSHDVARNIDLFDAPAGLQHSLHTLFAAVTLRFVANEKSF